MVILIFNFENKSSVIVWEQPLHCEILLFNFDDLTQRNSQTNASMSSMFGKPIIQAQKS